MNGKRIAITCALALVVTGCIIAAGCTQSEDPIVGIWAGDDVKYVTGETDIFLANGTGYCIVNYLDGSTGIDELAWTKNDDGTYTVMDWTGRDDIWTVDAGTTAKSERENTAYVKKALDGTAAQAIGCWYNADNLHVATFNADGSGTYFKGNESTNFSWTDIGSNTLRLHMLDGPQKDADYDWTYDTETDTFTSPHDLVYSRPFDRMEGFGFNRIIIETPADQIAGQWIKTSQNDGQDVVAILTVNKTAEEGYRMTLGDVEGIQLTDICRDTWKKTGDNTYEVTLASGTVRQVTYDSASDTATGDDGTVYQRLDPIVGIWAGTSSEGDNGRASLILKHDGTGVGTVAYYDGTPKTATLTWKKTGDDTYAIAYSSGDQRIYTLDDTKTLLTSDSGAVKMKEFTDSTFLTSVVGIWYNKDKNVSYVFNADNTGFGIGEKGTLTFIWEQTGLGEFELWYTGSGTYAGPETDEGNIFTWTYDRENNVLVSAHGTTYVRPTASISDRAILYD